ncbi:hypothetical protein J14TS2_16620 [Bacillus sp. J14TS2]|uniref:SAP domain-containing protein n=1 Tax=Bacillus sp. J14TS2 TaxID=2807188 RepID=UPI001B091D74|nr:SAP domain-containing protein [Bacillus sp. J14TS2]GIN71187.1 hypothetical protein J14TS2_16620 [Bacillus sp. J14TS2]
MGILNFLFKKKPLKISNPSSTNEITNIEFNVEKITKNEINPIYLEELGAGVLPGEVVLLDWIGSRSNNSAFPGYYEYQYGIDPKKSVNKLIQKGYIRKSTPLESVSSLKVPDIKGILKTKKLMVSGKKVDLISRIEENFSSEEIKPFIKEQSFKLAEPGSNILKMYYYIVAAHKYNSNDGTYNVATAIQYMNSLSHDNKPTNSEISWSLYQSAYIKFKRERSYGLMRNTIFKMAEQLQRENSTDKSVVYYLRVFILDLSGMSNSSYVQLPKLLTIAPGIISRIKATLNENITKDVSQYFNKSWAITCEEIPFHYFDKDTCYGLLLETLEVEDSDFSLINSKIINKATVVLKKIDPSTFEIKYGLIIPDWSI